MAPRVREKLIHRGSNVLEGYYCCNGFFQKVFQFASRDFLPKSDVGYWVWAARFKTESTEYSFVYRMRNR